MHRRGRFSARASLSRATSSRPVSDTRDDERLRSSDSGCRRRPLVRCIAAASGPPRPAPALFGQRCDFALGGGARPHSTVAAPQPEPARGERALRQDTKDSLQCRWSTLARAISRHGGFFAAAYFAWMPWSRWIGSRPDRARPWRASILLPQCRLDAGSQRSLPLDGAVLVFGRGSSTSTPLLELRPRFRCVGRDRGSISMAGPRPRSAAATAHRNLFGCGRIEPVDGFPVCGGHRGLAWRSVPRASRASAASTITSATAPATHTARGEVHPPRSCSRLPASRVARRAAAAPRRQLGRRGSHGVRSPAPARRRASGIGMGRRHRETRAVPRSGMIRRALAYHAHLRGGRASGCSRGPAISAASSGAFRRESLRMAVSRYWCARGSPGAFPDDGGGRTSLYVCILVSIFRPLSTAQAPRHCWETCSCGVPIACRCGFTGE